MAVGVAQAVAIFPGISRSGSTVAVGTALGINTIRMAEFSFLLSIPAIGGAAVLQLRDVSSVGAGIGAGPLAVAFTVAAVSGIFAIHIFLGMLDRRTFHRFAYYCWGIGLTYLLAATIWPELR
jgi:undecaprenyl-diphosphatase